MKRILVVEDNPDLAYGLRNNLEIEGYDVDVVEDGTQGLARARVGGPDLIILDLMLPGMDGYRVLRALRDEGRRMPVLILTARGEEADKVRGLRLGADDYVTKPFGVLELLARVEALLRRTAPPGDGAGPPERFGVIEVIPASRSVLKSGKPVPLTPKLAREGPTARTSAFIVAPPETETPMVSAWLPVPLKPCAEMFARWLATAAGVTIRGVGKERVAEKPFATRTS